MNRGQFQPGDPPEVRFWRYVETEANTGCWLWSGAANGEGYGTFHVRPKNLMAHRFSWSLHNGPIPDGLFALHKCDTPACVNPDHLFLGTKGDNARDKARKGRCHDNRGERHGMSKLTDFQVSCIRLRLDEGQTQTRIAADFGVAQCTISDIATGRRRNRQRSH
jgi:hypothetical protein